MKTYLRTKEELRNLIVSGVMRTWSSKREKAPEYIHLIKTYKSLMGTDRRKGPNPRVVTEFRLEPERFVRWSLENGFSLRSELELTDPEIIEGTRRIDRWHQEWVYGLLYNEEQIPYEYAEDAGEREWITDYSMRWTKHKKLLRRKQATLTPYGESRLKELRKNRKKTHTIKARGKEMSARAWSKVEGCTVSDKVIVKRINAGWSREDAIFAPKGAAGRPRKKPCQN